MEAKFQRPHSEAGPDFARLMLASSRRMEAMTNLPKRRCHRSGPNLQGADVGHRLGADGGSSWMTTPEPPLPIHAERGPVKQAEGNFGLEIDAAAERAFERRLQPLAVLIGGDVGSDHGGQREAQLQCSRRA